MAPIRPLTGCLLGTACIISFSTLSGGCAHRRSDSARMESQLGMLDERVSQLERGGFSMNAPSTPSSDSVHLPTVTEPVSASQALEDRLWTKPTPYDVQQALRNAGLYQGPVDGKPGPLTKAAIREFQRANGLKADGVVGKRTWEKLSPHLEASTVASSPVAPVK